MQKILAIKLRAIGDTVIWTSALSRLHEVYPEAEIHVLTLKSNRAVLDGHPAVTHFHGLNSLDSKLELITQLWNLRRFRFDWLLGFHATTSLCRWAWLTKAKQMCLHHHSWPRTPRGSVPVPHAGRLETALIRDLRVLQGMGIPGGENALKTQINLGTNESSKAEARMQEAILAATGDIRVPRLGFLPGASHHLRQYPKDQLLAEVLKTKELGRLQPVILVDEQLSASWGLPEWCARQQIPLIDKSSLREFVALISRLDRAVANDSGPGHIAVALGLGTDFIFGPGCVGDWHAYDRTLNPVHRIAVDCRDQGPRDREEFQFCVRVKCAHHSCLRQLKLDLDLTSVGSGRIVPKA